MRSAAAAGIRPVMITGDHKDTAVAIAKELGIIDRRDPGHHRRRSWTTCRDEELAAAIDALRRLCPRAAGAQGAHRQRLEGARAAITAMTGDGVNDAPSIKSADIGVGMGITGTDVTKNVADMVLADDNFATIVGAVERGPPHLRQHPQGHPVPAGLQHERGAGRLLRHAAGLHAC